MNLLHLFAALALAASTFAAPRSAKCGTTHVVFDGYQKKNFTVGPNSDCKYELSWRDETGALIAAHVDGIDSDYLTSVAMYNEFSGGRSIQFGNHSDYFSVFDSKTYWAPGSVMLSIRTGKNSNVVVTVEVSVANVTKDAIIQKSRVITGQQPIVITDELVLGNTYVYTSTSQIVFACPSAGSLDGNVSYWDSIFVYDDQGANAVLIGSLGQLYQANAYKSYNNTITLFPLAKAEQAGKIIINNLQSTGAFNLEKMLYFFSHYGNRNSTGVLLDSREGRPGSTSIVSFGTVGNQPDYPIITGIRIPDEHAVVKVFSGLPSKDMRGNYLMQFTNATATNMSPQPFPGTAVTFTISKGYAVISYTSALTPDAKK